MQAFQAELSKTGKQLFNYSKGATWGDDKDGENDWLSTALVQRLAQPWSGGAFFKITNEAFV